MHHTMPRRSLPTALSMIKRMAAPMTAFMIVLMALLMAAPLRAELQEPIGSGGYMDWQTLRVVASGMGIVPAGANPAQATFLGTRAATVDARRNLLEVIRGVRVESSTLIQNYMVQSDTVTSQVQGFVQGAQVDSTRVTDDGVYHVTVSLPLTGRTGESLNGLLGLRPQPLVPSAQTSLPPAVRQRMDALERQVADLAARLHAVEESLGQQNVRITSVEGSMAEQSGKMGALQARLADPNPPKPAKPQAQAVPVATPEYTGIVVDARSTGFAPCLRPQLFAGQEQLFPSPAVDHQRAATDGYVRYLDSLPVAQRQPRVGQLPLTVKATGIVQGNAGALTLGEADAAILRAMLGARDNALDSCRIVIVF